MPKVRAGASRFYRILMGVMLTAYISGLGLSMLFGQPQAAHAFSVPGQNYNICDEQAQYLTSPWTYDALASGSQTYTVAQYQALTGYGTTLPPLPSYVIAEGAAATAAVIMAPGSADASSPAYDYPMTPLVYFFEGGSYPALGLDSVSGDEFIGGSAPGFPEPIFNDNGAAGGINAQNGSYYWSGGDSTLASTADTGATTITTVDPIPGYINNVTFADGSTYDLASASGTTLTLNSPLTTNETAGSAIWANQTHPVAEVASSAAQGATTVMLTSSSIPLVPYGSIRLGSHNYVVQTVSGSESGYTITVKGLDIATAANTPVYYDDLAGDVTVQYLNIDKDEHNTTGTIYTGTGWTIENNDIHDGYSTPGLGVAIYGGDEGTIEYNCLSRMGDYGVNIFGDNNKFDYNEVYETDYLPDPGCGCSGGGKWWGTLNADIVDNAFIDDSPGGTFPVWLDNGNSGTLIQGNYFDKSQSASISSETGFNLDVTDNLFQDDNWGTGSGCGNPNCTGDVGLNSSGGFYVPGSRYEDEIIVSGNQFQDDWGGVSIWQAGGRTCENSGEGWPDDAPYCSGGYPNTATTAAGGQFYFSHNTDLNRDGTLTLAQAATAGSSTVLVSGSEAIDDQIGFADPVSTTTSDTTDVTTFNGAGVIHATSTTGFPTSGQLRVGTSAAWSDGDGSWTGAILSYTGTTSSTFTGVSFVRGAGTLSGPLQQVQQYKVNSETCYANDCAVNITPSLTSDEAANSEVSNAGTCQLYATAAALPNNPLAPDGTSYWDGCQWSAGHISVTGNTFIVAPSQMNDQTALTGGTVQCTLANYCGTNFMAYQVGGEAPFADETSANAMMSNSALTGCPAWDTGCTTNPFTNLNAGSDPPDAPVGNGEAPYDNVWSDNTYSGPWSWGSTYLYGNCGGGGVVMPNDPSTGHSLTASACNDSQSQFESDWEQDIGSTYNPAVAGIGNLSANQEIYGAAQAIKAYQDTDPSHTLNGTLSVNSTPVTTTTTSPLNYSLNTLGFADGSYNIKFSTSDSGGNTNSVTVPVYISNGDLNGDGSVNISDLAVMASHWGQTDSNYADGNITGQSTINLSDLAVMAANWGWSHP